MGSHLVGVDGSPSSAAAAAFAADWAARAGQELHLLHSYPHTLALAGIDPHRARGIVASALAEGGGWQRAEVAAIGEESP